MPFFWKKIVSFAPHACVLSPIGWKPEALLQGYTCIKRRTKQVERLSFLCLPSCVGVDYGLEELVAPPSELGCSSWFPVSRGDAVTGLSSEIGSSPITPSS